MTEKRYIAMWSGPRNISTAMMRSWDSRADTYVYDEPLYAHYLANTDYDHPGRDEVIATYENDWRKVVAELTGEIPNGKTISYQKHMAHHMLPNTELAWILNVTNCFLIREPKRMILSFAKVFPNPTIEQTGLLEQIQLFDYVREHTGSIPPVIDAKDVLLHPRRILSRLCAAIDVPFDDAMLSWEPGPRETDGNWAKYWYATVEKSTGFAPYIERDVDVPDHLRGIIAECNALYEQMAAHRIT